MPASSITISQRSLIGGVSQQPVGVRSTSPAQCEEQVDAYISVADGLGKRFPIEHVSNITPTFDGGAWNLGNRKPWIRWIDIDTERRYVVAVDESLLNGVKVWDTKTGQTFPVVLQGGTQMSDYLGLNGGSPADDLEIVTTGERSFILNRTVKVRMDPLKRNDVYNASSTTTPDWRSRSNRRSFIFVRDPNYLSQYRVRVNIRHTTAGWIPEESRDKTNVAGVKTFDGDSKSYKVGTNAKGIPYEGFGWGSAGDAPQIDQPPYDPVNDVHEGRQIGTLELDTIAQAIWNRAAEPKSPTATVFTSRDPGGIKDVYLFEATTGPSGQPIEKLVRVDADGDLPQASSVVKLELLAAKVSDPLFREEIRVETVKQGEGTNALITFGGEIARFEDLPIFCEHGHVVKVTNLNEAGDESNGFYVRFERKGKEGQPARFPSDDMGEGSWTETAQSGIATHLDPATMPVEMVFVDDASGGHFLIRQIAWQPRAAGDDDSNPEPSFVGKSINDVFIFQNRLGFITDTHVVLSQADKFTNFWRTTVQQVPDDDPIDREASHNRPPQLRYAVALDRYLMLFGSHAQFTLSYDGPLTPKTAGILPTSNHDTMDRLRPLASDRGIFFAYEAQDGDFSHVQQLLREGNSDAFRPFPVTGQVPRYIRGKAVEMTSTPRQSVLAMRTNDRYLGHVLWIYKWLDEGDGRLLSSWMKFTIGPAGEDDSQRTHCECLGMHFFDDDLVMLVRRRTNGGDYFHLEKMVFTDQRLPDATVSSAGRAETDMPFRVLLDRRVDETQCFFAYNEEALTLDVRLPYLVQGEQELRCITRAESGTGPPGEDLPFTLFTFGAGGDMQTVISIPDEDRTLYDMSQTGDLRFFVGQTYTMTYEFSQFVRQRQTNRGVPFETASSNLNLFRAVVSFGRTGFARVQVLPRRHDSGADAVDRAISEVILPSIQVGYGDTLAGHVNIRDEHLTVPLRARAEDIRVLVSSEAPYPCNVTAIEATATEVRPTRSFQA